MKNITMIAAVGKNLELGKDNDLIERIKSENPEKIYRISEIEPFDGHKVVDSSSRYGYIITRG